MSRCDSWAFEVRRGFFSPYQWVVRYDEVLELGPDSVKIARSDTDLLELAAGELPHSWPRTQAPEGDEELPSAPGERDNSNALARAPHVGERPDER